MEVDVLGLLAKLQNVADEIDRLEARRRASTEERDRAASEAEGTERALAEKEERQHALDIERRKREMVLKSEKERMQRVKGRLGDVKTSREYQAVLTEISTAKQTIAEQEEGLLRDMQSLEEIGAQVTELKAKLEVGREKLESAEQELSASVEQTEGAIGQRKAEESELLKTLPIEVVDRYRLIRMRRGGLAVVEARDEACTACFMRIPPQTYIEVIRKTRVIQCPNCHRILIPPQASEPAEDSEEEGPNT